MTAFCKVSLVRKDAAPPAQLPGEGIAPAPTKPKPAPTKPKPAPAAKPRPAPPRPKRKQKPEALKVPRRPARGGFSPTDDDSFPEPFEDDSGALDFSELERKDDDFPPEDEWEEVHESVGDDMSTGYPSDSEPTLIKETRRRPKAHTESWTKSPQAEDNDVTTSPRRRYSGDELDLEEEVF